MHNLTFKPITKNIIYISIMSIFIGWYQVNAMENLPFGNKSVDLLVIKTFSDLNIYSIKFIFPVLIWLFPQLFLIYIMGNLLNNDLKNRAVYLFTRTKNRSSWFFSITISLFLNTLLYFCIQYSLVIIIGIVKGYEIKNIAIILISLILMTFISFLLLLFINVFNLFFNPSFSYNLVLSVYIFLILLTGVIGEYASGYSGLLVSFPFSQAIITWHDFPEISYLQNDFSFYVSGYSINDSLVYIFILVTLLFVVAERIIRKMDIM